MSREVAYKGSGIKMGVSDQRLDLGPRREMDMAPGSRGGGREVSGDHGA